MSGRFASAATGVAFLSPAIAVDGTPITARVELARLHRRMRVETGQVEMRKRMASPKLSFAGEGVGFWRLLRSHVDVGTRTETEFVADILDVPGRSLN